MKKFKLLFCILLVGIMLVSMSISAMAYEAKVVDELNNDFYNLTNKELNAELLDLADEIRSMKTKGKTDKEIELYVNNELQAKSGLYDYITDELNSQEQTLFNSNPVKGVLCMANGVLAIEYAEDNYYSYVLHNNNGDAFRHTLWCFGMGIDVGNSFAEDWSDAHEYGASGQPTIERSMDLFNNEVGLQLAEDFPNTFWHSTFISKSKAKVSGGYCRRISNDSLIATSTYGLK